MLFRMLFASIMVVVVVGCASSAPTTTREEALRIFPQIGGKKGRGECYISKTEDYHILCKREKVLIRALKPGKFFVFIEGEDHFPLLEPSPIGGEVIFAFQKNGDRLFLIKKEEDGHREVVCKKNKPCLVSNFTMERR